jgi:hypothetical protein
MSGGGVGKGIGKGIGAFGAAYYIHPLSIT